MIRRWLARRAARRAADEALVEFWANAAAIARVERRIKAGEEPGRLLAVTDCRVLTSDRHALAAQQHNEIDEYDTVDVVAEVIGPLSYEEQSEMIGDPAAEVILRETED